MKITIRNVVVLSLCLVMFFSLLPNRVAAFDDIAVNEENFPNAAFRGYVSSQADIDRNGILTEDEINLVTWIDIESRWLDYDRVIGLEYFSGLEKLTGTNLSLGVLDVSNFRKLKHLACWYNQLETLDISNNTALEYLDCHVNRIQNLIIGNNTALKTLECQYNRVQTLDISNCPNIECLTCQNTSLQTMDISNNPYLLAAYLYGTKKNLTDGGIQYYTSKGYQVVYSLSISPDCEIICASFTEQPKNQTVVAGKEATFSVTAQGVYARLQWYQQKKGESEWTALPGATDRVLTITATTDLNSSKYRCVLRCTGEQNTFEVSSDEATLSVISKPKITTQPKAAKVKAGRKVTFKVKAKGLNLKYQWYRLKPGTKKWVKISKATKATYSFKAAKKWNGYKYRCIVRNAAGSVKSKAVKLTVK